jgi:hypothetical protein
MDRDIFIYSLNRYIKENKEIMKYSSLLLSDRMDIFYKFLNTHKIILDWNDDHVQIYKMDSQYIDRDLYLSFKTFSCIEIASGRREISLPSQQDISYRTYWMTILSVVQTIKYTMRVKIVIYPEKMKVSYKWL